MEHDFWHGVWERDSIGFHQDDIHPFLTNHFPQLFNRFASEQVGIDTEVSKSTVRPKNTVRPMNDAPKVFVPLCGKSSDMLFLANKLNVVGSELSPIACRDFFEDNELSYNHFEQSPFQYYQNDDINLIQGDFFALSSEQLGSVNWIYDRAALIALPPEMRTHYLSKLKSLMGEGTKLFLVTLEYPQSEMQGPPFAVMETEVQAAFNDFTVEKITDNDITGKFFGSRTFKLSSAVERLYLIY